MVEYVEVSMDEAKLVIPVPDKSRQCKVSLVVLLTVILVLLAIVFYNSVCDFNETHPDTKLSATKVAIAGLAVIF